MGLHALPVEQRCLYVATLLGQPPSGIFVRHAIAKPRRWEMIGILF